MGPYSLGFCEWDIPALILVIVVTVVIVAHNYRHRMKVDEYKNAIEEIKEGDQKVDNGIETE